MDYYYKKYNFIEFCTFPLIFTNYNILGKLLPPCKNIL